MQIQYSANVATTHSHTEGQSTSRGFGMTHLGQRTRGDTRRASLPMLLSSLGLAIMDLCVRGRADG